MAKKPFISVDGITVGEANALVNVILANGDITTSNITIGNNANLGNVGNIIITGGSSGYVLSTNGSGNLSWVAQSGGGGNTSNISNGNSNVNIATANGNITMSAVGNANIVVITGTGASINGLLSITGNIIPTANITYDLGNNTNRFKDLYLSGNTINLGDSNLSSNATTVTITNQLGGQFIVGGTSTVNSANLTGYSIANGNSNVSVAPNGNVTISSAGNANIVVITGTGMNVAGTANVTGNLSVGNITTGAGTGGNITGANVISANTFTASGNITAGNANLGNSVTANYFIGSGANLTSISGANVSGAVSYATTANSVAGANVSGQVANSLIAGTVYTNAQPNITSVGTLTSLTVSGSGSFGANVNLNNFNITNLATPNASTDAATKQYVDDIAQGLNVHDAVAAATPTTLASITSGTITYNNGASGVGANLTTTGSFNLIDGVNVQTSGTRILVKNEANAVYNGIYTWSNATVITRATDYNSVPEVEAGDFVFCTGGTLYDNTGWAQTSTVTAIGTAGNNIEFTQFSGAGTYQAGTGLTLTGSTFSVNASQTQITSVGTLSNLTVSGNATVGNLVTSGSGGNVSNVNVVSANTFTASGNITSGNANLGNSVTANYFIGNLYGTANLATYATTANAVAGGNVSGQVGNSLVSGTVYTNAQPNITSVGTLTGITSTGTINLTGASNVALGPIGNVHITGGSSGQYLQTDGSGTLSWASISSSATLANGNSNVNIPSSNGNVNISAVGNANIVVVTGTGANITGTLNVTGNATVGNLITSGSGGTLSNINVVSANTFTASGNITSGNANLGNSVTANYFIGTFYGTANLATYATTANSVAGANVSGQVANALVSGTVYTNAQPNITSTGTLTSLAVTGNITSGNANLGNAVTSNYFIGNFYGTANLATFATTANAVAGANVSGQVGNALIAGTVYTAAQPNITSVGTLTGITSVGTANFTGASNVALGPIANIHITGGSNAYVLSTDGSGNLSWVAQSGGGSTSNISNGNSNVNIPTSNGNINFTAVGNTNMVITGTGVNVAGTLNVTGNANVSNIGATNGVFTNVTGNGSGLSAITGANVTGTVPSATSAGTAGTAGYATNSGSATSAGYANVVTDNAQPNITSVGTLTSLAVTGTANLGAVGNVKITGGGNGYVLTTDGAGNLSWASQTGSNIVVDSFTGNGVQTVFTLTNAPTSEDYTIINIDGVSQLHSAYTVANANVTLSSAPASGAAIEVMTFNLSGGGGGGGNSSGGYTYVEVTANTTATANTKYIVNTNTSNITVTLPSSPTLGTEVGIIDGTGNASVHAITVGRNGGNIQGTASDMTVTTNRSAFTLVYYNAAQGWILTNV